MGRIVDLMGQRFGQLTVQHMLDTRIKGGVVWLCLCDCGQTKEASSQTLIKGHIKTCGTHKVRDLRGQRFGKLLVVKKLDKRSDNSVVWECVCDCGNIKQVSTKELNKGNVKSCGCLQFRVLTGQKFGKLTALRPTDKRHRTYVVWECICECGNLKEASLHALLYNKVKSCGCLRSGRKPVHT